MVEASGETYVFGHSETELARLVRQAALYAPITRDVFLRAGLRPGMRVLDVGCGAGDVSLLAAEMVGPRGAVLSVDRAPEALATTAARARQAGIDWIETAAHDLGAVDLPRSFDAVVGRLVLCYVPQRVDLIRRLSAALNPGGVFAFVEMDVSCAVADPPSALYARANGWIAETMRRGGFEPEMGSKLYATFAAAGFEAELAAYGVAAGGPRAEPIVYVRDVVRTLVPMMAAAGVATASEIDIDTFAERLGAEAGIAARTFYLPRLTGAWARTPAADV